MKVNTISRSNYSIKTNNYSIKTNNNSKPAFKGKNFARVLENFDFSPYGDFPHDQVPKGIKKLLELASKEPGFKLLNKELYEKLKEPKTSYEFWDLFDELYRLSHLNTKGPIIARDSQGPLIKYGETKEGLLEFVSKDQSGNDQSVTIGVKPLSFLFHVYRTRIVPNGVLF